MGGNNAKRRPFIARSFHRQTFALRPAQSAAGRLATAAFAVFRIWDKNMQTVLIVIHLLVVVALIATVLLQRSEGGALGMGGGGSGGGGFFTGRGQANALTRATAILATLFFITSLSLTILASYNRSQKSIFESGAAPAAPVSTAPASAPEADGSFLGRVKQTVVDGLTQFEQKLESLTGSKPATPTSAAPTAATPPADSTRAAPDAAQPKGTVLDQLKQMEKNAPPPAAGGQAPPRAR
jgi:preprotein translocase subunit SecG